MPVGSYRYVQFCVDMGQTVDTRIEGSLGVSPDSLEVELLLFHIDDFNRWATSAGAADTLFFSRMSSGPVTIPITGFGDMVLVVSNRGNYSPASVTASLALAFEGTGAIYNPMQTATRLVLVMMGLAVVITIVLSIVRVMKRKTRTTAR